MTFSNFPGSDEKVSALGLGTWVFDPKSWGGSNDKESVAAVKEAIDQGLSFIDTAPIYGFGHSEKIIGQAIKGNRDKVFVATKCGLLLRDGIVHDLSRKSILQEMDESLLRLQCDVIDLYQCHWPDESTPIEETMDTLLSLQSKGKIRHIGVSNFEVDLLKQAAALAPIRTLQVPYSLLDRKIEKEILPFCLENKIGVMTYGSMAGGILTGKYSQPKHFENRDARKMLYDFYEGDAFEKVTRALEELKTLEHPLNQLALNWVRQQPGVMTVLVGCRNALQVQKNVQAVSWNLSDEDLAFIAKVAFDRD